MTQTLGTLKRVELRDIWKTEDRDFTPWLAKEEHLKILGKTLGIELEFEAQEKEVGPFRADILCKNTLDDSWVLIENQLEKTDHRHLGQLMTYAAGLHAVNIVWIASEFQSEHRAAIDWLNSITDEDFRFFGLEVEAWQIDNSIPAPRFNVVSQPNDWSKNVAQSANRIANDTLGEVKELQGRYWTSLSQCLSQNSRMSLRTPRPQNWADFSLGKTNAILRVSANTQAQKIVVGVYLSKNMRFAFDDFGYEESVKEAFGDTLEWENEASKQTAVIKIEKKANISDEGDWESQQLWLKDMLEKFDDVFRPLVTSFGRN
jgi:hypothetical protein